MKTTYKTIEKEGLTKIVGGGFGTSPIVIYPIDLNLSIGSGKVDNTQTSP